ncbi:MAG TPA: hypothetical protein VID27_15240, partial [Blastocatellia bacterium]
MFTRHVIMSLKANSDAEFTRLIENEILPSLLEQEGFLDEITFIAPERAEALAITFWETRENAEAYDLAGYPEALNILSDVVEGTTRAEIFEVF